MMRAIDADLSKEDVSIPHRPIRAVIAVGTMFKLAMPFFKPSLGAPAELKATAQLSENIHAWYEAAYGDRLKLDMGMGKMVIELDRDLYILAFPRIMGSVQFVTLTKFIDAPRFSSNGPAICNILQLVQDLTEAKAGTLSIEALRGLDQKFNTGLEAHDILESSQKQELIRIARGDILTAINTLMDRHDRFAESKWASLQAAEKTLKAAIVLQGGMYKNTHDLAKLCEHLESLGLRFNWFPLTSVIQCSPAIRYGDEPCSREEALAAHQASLKLVVALKDAGTKFEQSLL
ncbi:HEPN domain-containing protein [Devosia sp. UYZn731]|uniref:HEPN domain-containing protein n=1 Tax=Devosia sp. UYZn731 TaxID=3156345 RepID=UPI003397B12D